MTPAEFPQIAGLRFGQESKSPFARGAQLAQHFLLFPDQIPEESEICVEPPALPPAHGKMRALPGANALRRFLNQTIQSTDDGAFYEY
jgi:hypothetical protein